MALISPGCCDVIMPPVASAALLPYVMGGEIRLGRVQKSLADIRGIRVRGLDFYGGKNDRANTFSVERARTFFMDLAKS